MKTSGRGNTFELVVKFAYATKIVLITTFEETCCMFKFPGKADLPVLHSTETSLSFLCLSTMILLEQLKGTFTGLLCTLTLASFFTGINNSPAHLFNMPLVSIAR